MQSSYLRCNCLLSILIFWLAWPTICLSMFLAVPPPAPRIVTYPSQYQTCQYLGKRYVPQEHTEGRVPMGSQRTMDTWPILKSPGEDLERIQDILRTQFIREKTKWYLLKEPGWEGGRKWCGMAGEACQFSGARSFLLLLWEHGLQKSVYLSSYGTSSSFQ